MLQFHLYCRETECQHKVSPEQARTQEAYETRHGRFLTSLDSSHVSNDIKDPAAAWASMWLYDEKHRPLKQNSSWILAACNWYPIMCNGY